MNVLWLSYEDMGRDIFQINMPTVQPKQNEIQDRRLWSKRL
jgi:hypothetical protein